MPAPEKIPDNTAALCAATPKVCATSHAAAPVPDVQLPSHTLCPAEEQRFVSNYFVALAAGMAGSRQVSDDSAALGAAGPKACTAPHASAPVPDVQLPAHPMPS